MVMKKNSGNVRGEVRVNFLALFASEPHIFMCRAPKLSGIVRANFRLNIALKLFWSRQCSAQRGAMPSEVLIALLSWKPPMASSLMANVGAP